MKALLVMMMLVPSMMFATEQTFTTKVSGNCGSCKKRITKAAEAVDGVSNFAWDKKTKVATVTYDDAKTSPDAVKKAIAAAGHDVENVKATNEAYDKLPDCCQYRDGEKTH